MKLDGAIMVATPREAAAAAEQLESLGFDGGFTFEGPHDPFLPLVAAALRTERIELGTAIAIAFARNPMLLAQIANDLQLQTKGRFVLGLGSQIKPHIEKRFSQPWSKPASRMREMVQAIRAIWRVWSGEDGKLDFRGEFYTHTLMTPVFNPGPNPHGNPPILVAGVGPKMTEVVAEVADGWFVHPFHTEEFIHEVSLPALERGFERGERSRADFQIAAQVIVATGETEEEFEASKNAARAQISFYGSTPAYRPVLDCIGRGELQDELNAMSKRGHWLEMATRIDDELLAKIAVVAPPDELAARLEARCKKYADRLTMISPATPDPARWAPVVKALRQA